MNKEVRAALLRARLAGWRRWMSEGRQKPVIREKGRKFPDTLTVAHFNEVPVGKWLQVPDSVSLVVAPRRATPSVSALTKAAVEFFEWSRLEWKPTVQKDKPEKGGSSHV